MIEAPEILVVQEKNKTTQAFFSKYNKMCLGGMKIIAPCSIYKIGVFNQGKIELNEPGPNQDGKRKFQAVHLEIDFQISCGMT